MWLNKAQEYYVLSLLLDNLRKETLLQMQNVLIDNVSTCLSLCQVFSFLSSYVKCHHQHLSSTLNIVRKLSLLPYWCTSTWCFQDKWPTRSFKSESVAVFPLYASNRPHCILYSVVTVYTRSFKLENAIFCPVAVFPLCVSFTVPCILYYGVMVQHIAFILLLSCSHTCLCGSWNGVLLVCFENQFLLCFELQFGINVVELRPDTWSTVSV